jgi:hypothetical protein
MQAANDNFDALAFDPDNHFPWLSSLVLRLGESNPVHIHWDSVCYDSMHTANQYLRGMSEFTLYRYINQEMDSPPPPGPEWAHIHRVLGNLGCWAGCPGPAV